MLNILLLALPLVASDGQTGDTLEFVSLAAGGAHSWTKYNYRTWPRLIVGQAADPE